MQAERAERVAERYAERFADSPRARRPGHGTVGRRGVRRVAGARSPEVTNGRAP
jgi:hypothetical protein